MVKFKAWSVCIDCGHEGVLEYSRIPGEEYDDAESIGVMMVLHCPVCDSTEHTLVANDFYQEMINDPSNAQNGQE